jgi:hypothetical protein
MIISYASLLRVCMQTELRNRDNSAALLNVGIMTDSPINLKPDYFEKEVVVDPSAWNCALDVIKIREAKDSILEMARFSDYS